MIVIVCMSDARREY